jgi:hypothetical protein
MANDKPRRLRMYRGRLTGRGDEVGFQREVGIPITKFTGAEVHHFANFDRGWKGTEGIKSRLNAEASERDLQGNERGEEKRTRGLIEESTRNDYCQSHGIKPSTIEDSQEGDLFSGGRGNKPYK